MKTVLFGQETEYFVSVIGKKGKPVSKHEAIHLFFNLAKGMPSLRGPHDYGVFLVGRYLYLDCGEHIESATFECTDPWELVNHKLATEALIAKLAEDVRNINPDIQELLLSKVNVDYAAGSGTTWGEHESYQVHKRLCSFQDELIPHLVSRVIYTGAGGWHSSSPGLDFMISPRARFFHHEVSGESTRDRGIFHTKNETLVGSQYHYRRLHVICGESLYCHKSSLLKAGVTALIVKLIDLGAHSSSGIQPLSPLEALKSFSRDRQCGARVKTVSGDMVTAVDIQRYYHARVMDHISEMPAWAPEICEIWAETLDELASDPRKLVGVLDWPTKFEIFSRHMESHGFTWDEVEVWNRSLHQINNELGPLPDIHYLTEVMQKGSTSAEHRYVLDILKQNRLVASRIEDFLIGRGELFEIDVKCGQIGEKGIFASLDRLGFLRHHVDGINNETVECAKINPPKGSRAALRGECIRRLSANKRRYRCYWTHIEDLQARTFLNMFDPFEDKERWEAF